ncbi:MAG TPA: Hsp20/alpha crystallin family protein [Bryobacteraceae bacterium]|nr:Hsp20/alpha crystallin family protein [Bryobacteraceae bacterium]
MAVVKYNLPDMEDFPVGLRLFQDTVNRLLVPSTGRPWVPPVDIFETENEWVLKADLPDVKLEQVDIQIENGTLSLKGERKFQKDESSKGYRQVERAYGSFARYFSLPDTVDAEKVHADYATGVLTVTLPKKEVAKPRSIKVHVANN